MSRLASHTAPYLIVGLLCFVMGYWYGSGRQPVVPSPVREFISPEMLQSRVPQLRSIPTLRFIHTGRTDTLTRVDTVRVPGDFGYVGLVEQRPLSVTPDRVYLNYYDTGSARMSAEVYEVPQRTWSLDYGVQAHLTPGRWGEFSAGVFTELRYRNTSALAQMDYHYERRAFAPQIGLKVYL